MELCGWQRAKYINSVCKALVALYQYNMYYYANSMNRKMKC